MTENKTPAKKNPGGRPPVKRPGKVAVIRAAKAGTWKAIAAQLGISYATLNSMRKEPDSRIDEWVELGRAKVLQPVDDAMVREAEAGNPVAAKLVYARFGGTEDAKTHGNTGGTTNVQINISTPDASHVAQMDAITGQLVQNKPTPLPDQHPSLDPDTLVPGSAFLDKSLFEPDDTAPGDPEMVPRNSNGDPI